MKPLFSFIIGAIIMTNSSIANAQTDQIRRNARSVVEQFGPESGVADFGCNLPSMAYLDGFLSRQAGLIKQDQQTQDKFVSLFGSFVGECIISLYGGKWTMGQDGIQLEVTQGEKLHIIQPFHKVAKRVEFGESESLTSYFRDMLPAALGQPKKAKSLK